MTAYATTTQMLERYDERCIGDLVSDDKVRVSRELLTGNRNLIAALDDGAGEIESALLQAERYQVSDLTTLLAGTSNTRFVLIRLNCDVAMISLWNRRPWYEVNEAYKQRMEDAEKMMERLRKGERVFDIAAVKAAGLPAVAIPSVSSLNRLNLTVDAARRGYYPARRVPTGE